MGINLEVVALDKLIQGNVMERKCDAEMAAEIERLVDGHNVGAAILMRCLPSNSTTPISLLFHLLHHLPSLNLSTTH